MPKNHLKQRSIEASRVHSGAGKPSLTAEEREQVYEQIRERHSKAALQMAKEIHKRCSSEESETLLADAYRARIEDLLKLRMTVEAKALLDIVRERMPTVFSRLSELGQEVQLMEGSYEQIVAPLGNPELNSGERERIETFLRQRVEDLSALGEVASLPADHSIRVAAKALTKAFAAVTSGPVDPGQLALPEVSRRSPLASWKGLIRVIGSYYRGEMEEGRKWLETIAEDSVPARLLPAINALYQNSAGELSPAAKRLIEAVGDRGVVLRRAALAFDQALAGGKHKPILQAARKVQEASGTLAATERNRLRQHMAILCLQHDLSQPAVQQVLGVFEEDAYYLRMLAMTMESMGSGYAILAWSNFRDLAIRDRARWFAEGGPEDAVLSLHMARLVERMPRDRVEYLTHDDGHVKPEALRKLRGLLSSPEPLFARACQADPCAEYFQPWLDWAKKSSKPKNADGVAERWRKALPDDVRPLLHLVDSTEERGAFKKSLAYLKDAEDLDSLNPDVRRAKLRLLLAAAIRHLGQGKAHLAGHETTDILLLQEGPLHECTILACAIAWFCAALENDSAAMKEQAAALAQVLGEVGRHLLLMAIAYAAKANARIRPPEFDRRSVAMGEILKQTAHVCQLGELAGLQIPMQQGWNVDLAKHLQKSMPELDAARLLAFGEAALKDNARELAYAASVAGLKGDEAAARFLFLRARALPFWTLDQRRGCLVAAIALSRQERDAELTAQILDWIENMSRDALGGMLSRVTAFAAYPVAGDLLGAILEVERESNTFPVERVYRNPRYTPLLNKAQASAGPGGEEEFDEDFEDDEDFEEDEDDWDDEEDEDEDTDQTIDIMSILDKLLGRPPGGSRSKAAAGGRDATGQRKKPAPTKHRPEQGSLFGGEK